MTQESLFGGPELSKADVNECRLERKHTQIESKVPWGKREHLLTPNNPESHTVLHLSNCPRCQYPALKCHDGLTTYYRCPQHAPVLEDGSDYPAAYSTNWYNLHGVETQAQQMERAKCV